MPINLTDYMELLQHLQNTVSTMNSTIEATDYININWKTREVILPSSFSSFLTVENDHQADTIYFCTDRYFDSVDLSTQTCVIEYINAAGEGRICPILDIDLTQDPQKMYFGWKVSREATKRAGTIQFVVHFYGIDNNRNFSYSISTKPCSAKILKGLGQNVSDDSAYDYPAEVLEELYARMDMIENKAVLWRDLD